MIGQEIGRRILFLGSFYSMFYSCSFSKNCMKDSCWDIVWESAAGRRGRRPKEELCEPFVQTGLGVIFDESESTNHLGMASSRPTRASDTVKGCFVGKKTSILRFGHFHKYFEFSRNRMVFFAKLSWFLWKLLPAYYSYWSSKYVCDSATFLILLELLDQLLLSHQESIWNLDSRRSFLSSLFL